MNYSPLGDTKFLEEMQEELSEAHKFKEDRANQIAKDIKAIRANTDSIVDYFYQSMINLDILNKTLERSGKTLNELTEIKNVNSDVLKILQAEQFQTEKERLDLVSRLMKVDTGLPLVSVLQELISYILDNYEFKK